MALSINLVSPTSDYSVAFGQVFIMTAVVDSTTALTGRTLRIYVGAFEPNNFIMPYVLPTNYYQIVYGTGTMTWVGSQKYKNHRMRIVANSATQFTLTFDIIIGRDRNEVQNQLNPLEVLTPFDVLYSIYQTSRFLNLHIFEFSVGPNPVASVVASSELLGKLPIQQGSGFSYQFRDPVTNEGLGIPPAAADVLIDFSVFNTQTLNSLFYVLLFDADYVEPDHLLSMVENLNLEATDSSSATVSDIPNTSFNSFVAIAGDAPNYYKGTIEIDATRLIGGKQLGLIIITEDAVNRKYPYIIYFTPRSFEIPMPTVTTEVKLKGDIYRASYAFVNIAKCQEMSILVNMDPASYDASLASLSMSGSFATNLITINAYALDHLPADNEDLSGYTVLATGPNIFVLAIPSAMVLEYKVPANIVNFVTFIIFDYVFKDHSIRVPVKLLHPVLDDLEQSITNSLSQVVSCYEEDLWDIEMSSSDANAFDYNNLHIYDSGGKEVLPVDGFTGDSNGVEFQLQSGDYERGECFCIVASRIAPTVEAKAGCAANTMHVIQQNYQKDNIQIYIENTAGPGFLNPRSYLFVYRNGDLIEKFFIEDDWSVPVLRRFTIPYTSLNRFTYVLWIHTEDGCDYYLKFTLETNQIVLEEDTDTLSMEDICA